MTLLVLLTSYTRILPFTHFSRFTHIYNIFTLYHLTWEFEKPFIIFHYTSLHLAEDIIKGKAQLPVLNIPLPSCEEIVYHCNLDGKNNNLLPSE